MPAFVVKVTLKDGDLLPPISAMADDEMSAIDLVMQSGIAGPSGRVEAKGIRDDVMARAFGPQLGGTIVIRSNWGWSGDKIGRSHGNTGKSWVAHKSPNRVNSRYAGAYDWYLADNFQIGVVELAKKSAKARRFSATLQMNLRSRRRQGRNRGWRPSPALIACFIGAGKSGGFRANRQSAVATLVW
jgi:hypothetical protein